MKTKFSFIPATMLSVLGVGLLFSAASFAGKTPKPKSEYTASYCNQSGAQCGAIIYVNEGGYSVNWVRVTARGQKDQSSGFNAVCLDLEKKLKANLSLGEFHQFTVPATCKYTIKIDIKSGEKKKRRLQLTPGCILVTKSAGTTTKNNSIKKKKREFVSNLPANLKTYGEKNCKLD